MKKKKNMFLFKTAYLRTLSEASSVHFRFRFNVISSSPRSSVWPCTFRFSDLYEHSPQYMLHSPLYRHL
jgi:hypothetical protein